MEQSPACCLKPRAPEPLPSSFSLAFPDELLPGHSYLLRPDSPTLFPRAEQLLGAHRDPETAASPPGAGAGAGAGRAGEGLWGGFSRIPPLRASAAPQQSAGPPGTRKGRPDPSVGERDPGGGKGRGQSTGLQGAIVRGSLLPGSRLPPLGPQVFPPLCPAPPGKGRPPRVPPGSAPPVGQTAPVR